MSASNRGRRKSGEPNPAAEQQAKIGTSREPSVTFSLVRINIFKNNSRNENLSTIYTINFSRTNKLPMTMKLHRNAASCQASATFDEQLQLHVTEALTVIKFQVFI
jgi:hypothetical protein